MGDRIKVLALPLCKNILHQFLLLVDIQQCEQLLSNLLARF